ncbi:unnamed protein product, partial [Symbiodinium necroappetens]
GAKGIARDMPRAMASAPASGRHFRCMFALCRRAAAGSPGLPLVSQLPLRAILRDWTFDGWQHDAAELTLKFLRGIGLFGGRWEARYMDAAGLQTPHCGAMPLLIEVTQQAFMHGLTDAPEMLVLIRRLPEVVRLPLRDGGHNGLFADGEMAVEGAEKWQLYKRVDGRGKGNTGGGDQLDGRGGHSYERTAPPRSCVGFAMPVA